MAYFLYTILLYPVYMFVEFLFFTVHIITNGNIGMSIVLLSIGVNLICLPMYNVAETLQEKERAIQKRMKAKITDIKAVFKGDERYMILSTYYRQNNWHPLYALRSMVALFIQIPFFIAAYNLLSQGSCLDSCSFLFLSNLGTPDRLLSFGTFSVNVLPIIMTLVNIVASAVYTKGLELKDKITLYGTALIFLVLLYDSPSGLVFYWTLNNIFSLVKNIFYKITLRPKTWYLISVIAAFLSTGVVMAFTFDATKKPTMLAAFLTLVLVVVPFVKKGLTRLEGKGTFFILNDDRKRLYIFLSATVSLCLLIGLVIPSATIASSPQEFSRFGGIHHPLRVLYYPFIQSLGCFFYLFCIYKLFSKTVQKYAAVVVVLLLTASLINAFIFTGDYGDISAVLRFDDPGRLADPMRYFIANILVLIVACSVLILFLYSAWVKLLPSLLAIVMLTCVVITAVSGIGIHAEYRRMRSGEMSVAHKSKAYRVSKKGKNIFILMLDRSMNFFIDPIFEHCEPVKKEYTGFTVFENTVAFGRSTNFSTPSLFGGYEYTPEKINNRATELLVDKHNEALSVLPRLFSEHHWLVSFTDPSWLNYSWTPDLSVFSKYTMRSFNIDDPGKYSASFLSPYLHGVQKPSTDQKELVMRNMLYFSFFRILPSKVRKIFYHQGFYATVKSSGSVKMPFIDAYASLENLDKEVEFVPEGNCINIIVNNTTHEPPPESSMLFLHRNELIPLAKNYCLNEYTSEHFYANYVAHESCAKFFRFLKDNECWDNTRIIIAGDHGRETMRTSSMSFLDGFSGTDIAPESLIPLMMMKDFNASGPLHKDYSFMTLADIPLLTTKGLAPDMQKNPFTGVPFEETQDKSEVKAVHGGSWQADKHLHLTQFPITDKDWVYIKENVYDPKNWSKTPFVQH